MQRGLSILMGAAIAFVAACGTTVTGGAGVGANGGANGGGGSGDGGSGGGGSGCDAPAHAMRSGTYFMIAAITKPISAQMYVWAVVEMDPMTGRFKARFSKAKRNPDPNLCPMPCDATEVCRLLPMPACVAPSEPAGSVDEYPDFVADPDPPTGFGFVTSGCAVDQDTTTATFATAPVDIVVPSPAITLHNTALTASFHPDDVDVLRGAGSLVADAMLLGTIDAGPVHGDLTARLVPDEEAPAGLPGP